jgi:IS30 family transposase
LDTKPSPKLDDLVLTREIMRLFKQDLSADQIADRLRVYYPGRKEQQASSSTIYIAIYRETAKTPSLRVHLRNTLTLDNGKEFAAHKSLSQALGIDIYFAHPYRSWERGLNEHTNGLLRQYLPKKIPFDTLTQKQLDKIVAKINNRPRKVLGYLTLYEVFSP